MPETEPGFAETARRQVAADWQAACGHPFTAALGDGTLPPRVMADYLVQDYAFIGTLVSLIGFAIGRAPDMPAKLRLSAFLAALTSEENTYFQRSFEALEVPAAERDRPELHPVSEKLLAVMRDAGQTGSYGEILATLLPAEWIYLEWAEAQAHKAPGAPEAFWLREWIELHANPAFRDFVRWLRAETDRAAERADAAERAAMTERFARLVALEVEFFDVFAPR
jgi:thiaminase/transcriptional activator TenA